MLTGFPCVLVSATQSLRSSNARAVIRVGKLWRTGTPALALHITKPITWRCCAQVFIMRTGSSWTKSMFMLVPSIQNLRPKRGLYGVSHTPHRRALGRWKRDLHAMPFTGGQPRVPDPAPGPLRGPSASLSSTREHRSGLRFLPYDRTRLYGRGLAARSQFPHPWPDLGPVTGSPDACTDCHRDQT